MGCVGVAAALIAICESLPTGYPHISNPVNHNNNITWQIKEEAFFRQTTLYESVYQGDVFESSFALGSPSKLTKFKFFGRRTLYASIYSKDHRMVFLVTPNQVGLSYRWKFE